MTTPTLAARPRLLLDADTLARAKASTHVANLTAWCDARMTGTIYPPTKQDDSNNPPAVYPGYEGEEYCPTVVSMALAYHVTGNTAYADRAIAIMLVMANGTAVPSTDDGYIVRNYVRALALGCDFCHDRMTAAQLATISTCVNAFLAYWKSGNAFEDTPVAGNYWAGYFGVDALAALGLYEDNANAPADWDAWRNTYDPQTVADFTTHLLGGGWPEGFEYAPLAIENIALAVRAVLTATGEDLSDLQLYILDCARFVRHATWPDGSRPDDRDLIHSGADQGTTDPDLLWLLQYMLVAYQDPFAPAFRKLRNAHGAPSQVWRAVFYDEPSGGAETDPADLSYLAPGVGTAFMRSDWGASAVWASIRNAPYAGYPDAAEQFCDQGSLSIMDGSNVVLANPWGAWMRDAQANAIENKIGYDVQTGKPIFSVFMTDKGGQNQNGSGGNRTVMTDFGPYVYARCSNIEAMYSSGVTGWTREVVYLRPGIFVVRDTTSDNASDRWLQWHAMSAAISGNHADLGNATMDVPYPADAAITAQGAPAGFKAVTQQIQVRSPSNPGVWITVFQLRTPQTVTCTDGTTVQVGGNTVTFGADGVTVNGQAPAPNPAPAPAPSPAPAPAPSPSPAPAPAPSPSPAPAPAPSPASPAYPTGTLVIVIEPDADPVYYYVA